MYSANFSFSWFIHYVHMHKRDYTLIMMIMLAVWTHSSTKYNLSGSMDVKVCVLRENTFVYE